MNKFWKFRAKAGSDTASLDLYGDISSTSWYGDEVTPKQFKQDLDALGDVKNLNIYMNSGGGDVFAGQAIYAMLKRHSAHKTVYVDGLAGSIASVIAMAGDKIVMAKGSMMFIHNGAIGLFGYFNAANLREYADEVEKITQSVVLPAYDRTGQTREKVQELLDAETWMSDQEAVDMGFADEVEDTKQMAASLHGKILVINGQMVDLSRFKTAPTIVENRDESQPVSNTEPDLSAQTRRFLSLKDKLLNV